MNGVRVAISARNDLSQALVLVDPGHARKDPAQFRLFENVVSVAEKNTAAVRVAGSGALDLCYIACGRFDVMVHSGGAKPWDLAAGFLFVQENGGMITDIHMKPVNHMHGQFVAAKPDLHHQFTLLAGLK